MNNSYHIIISFVIASTVIIGFFYYNKAAKNQIQHTIQRHSIAIFEPALHPAIDEISDGFIDTINTKLPRKCIFKRYNANGNKTLLRAQAEEILQQHYDLVMTIGADATKVLSALALKKKIKTPIVFSAVTDPIRLGIVTSVHEPDNNITGIEEKQDYSDNIDLLLHIKPDTKTIILIYDPVIKNGIHELWADDIEAITQAKNISLLRVKVFHANEIQAKIQSMLTQADVVMVLTDHTIVTGIDSLITLCNRYNVTLYASDLNSGKKGAALAYGATEYDTGAEAAQMAYAILADHKAPFEISIVSSGQKKCIINKNTMIKQGLILSDEEIGRFLNNGGTII